MSSPIDFVDPEALAAQQHYTPSSPQVFLEINKWVKAAYLDLQLIKCLWAPKKDSLLGILEDGSENRSYISLMRLNWEFNIWKGTCARVHPHKIPYPIHGFFTPSIPLKSFLTIKELSPFFIHVHDYLARKKLGSQKFLPFHRRKVIKPFETSAAWIPGMDDISIYLRRELTKTYPAVPSGSILGRRTQKKVGRRQLVLNLVDTLQLQPIEKGTLIKQDFLLEFDINRLSIPCSRNTTFNIVAFIVNQTWRILSELQQQGVQPNIEKYLGEHRFQCRWCDYGGTSIIKIDCDPKFSYPILVYEATINCPKCHEISHAIFSSQESEIINDATRRLLICEICGREELQIISRKSSFGRTRHVKVQCPSCNNNAPRLVWHEFPFKTFFK